MGYFRKRLFKGLLLLKKIKQIVKKGLEHKSQNNVCRTKMKHYKVFNFRCCRIVRCINTTQKITFGLKSLKSIIIRRTERFKNYF